VPLKICVETDLLTLEARDRAELGELLAAAVLAPDDSAAWRPMRRARLLFERARILAEQDGVF
jgi:hypothetical protein